MCIGVSSACMSVHHSSARCWQSYRQSRATMWMLEMAPWSSGGVVSPLKRCVISPAPRNTADGTQGLMYARQVLCHRALAPAWAPGDLESEMKVGEPDSTFCSSDLCFLPVLINNYALGTLYLAASVVTVPLGLRIMVYGKSQVKMFAVEDRRGQQ